MAVDAASTVAAGGYWAHTGQWFYLPWGPHHVKLTDPRMQLSHNWKELYAMVVATALVARDGQHGGRRISIYSDNARAVDLFHFRQCPSRKPEIRVLQSLLAGITTDTRVPMQIFACHVPGEYNTIADAISRGRLGHARRLFPGLQPDAAALPYRILHFEAQLQSH